MSIVITSHPWHSVVPGPPMDPVCSFPAPGETFNVSWSPPLNQFIGGAEYNVTPIGCGNCTTNAQVTLCSGWEPRGQTCTLTAETVTLDCGLTSEMSETETVNLRGEVKSLTRM